MSRYAATSSWESASGPAGPSTNPYAPPPPSNSNPYVSWPPHQPRASATRDEILPPPALNRPSVAVSTGPHINPPPASSSAISKPSHPHTAPSQASLKPNGTANQENQVSRKCKDVCDLVSTLDMNLDKSHIDGTEIRRLCDEHFAEYATSVSAVTLKTTGPVQDHGLGHLDLDNLEVVLKADLNQPISTSVTIFNHTSGAKEVHFPMGSCNFVRSRGVRIVCTPANPRLADQGSAAVNFSFLPTSNRHNKHQFYICMLLKDSATGDKTYFLIKFKLNVTMPPAPTPLQLTATNVTNLAVIDAETGLSSAAFQDSGVLLKRATSKPLEQYYRITADKRVDRNMILPILGTFASGIDIYEVHHVPHGACTLLQFIERQTDPDSLWMYPIAEKLAKHISSLNSFGYYHRDLNSSNIIVSRRVGTLDVFIIGLGHLVSVTDSKNSLPKYSEPIGHKSIRHWTSQTNLKFDPVVDSFAFAALILEMLCKSRHARTEGDMTSGTLRKKDDLPPGVSTGHNALLTISSSCYAPTAKWNEIIQAIQNADPTRPHVIASSSAPPGA